MDTFLVGIPVNLCPISQGNPEPNMVAGSDHCTETMTCEPWFKPRGGRTSQFTASTFNCRCKIGYRYPVYQPGPYPGTELGKKTTREEKDRGYKCLPIGNKMVWPTELGLTHIGENKGTVQFTRRRRSTENDMESTIADEEDNEETAEVREFEETKMEMDEEKRLKQGESMERTEKLREWLEARNISLSEFVNVPDVDASEGSQSRKEFDEKKHTWIPRFDPNWLPGPSQPPHNSILHSRHRREANAKKIELNSAAADRTDQMLNFINAVTPENCHSFEKDQLLLQGGVGYGADKQFNGEATTALRLAHFLSAFMQNNEGAGSIIGDYRLGQELHEHHIFGELVANVAGSMDIVSSGVFFERNSFINSDGERQEYFGPLMYRDGEVKANSFAARNTANFGNGYAGETWYRVLHERWASNTYSLEKIRILPWIRPVPSVKYMSKFVKFPLYFRAPRLEDGYWTQPYFDCTGPVPEWIITYAVPFFGSSLGKVEFRGVVTVSVPLKRLHINQCPGAFHEANFFQGSALCESDSTYCKHVWGYGLQKGHYECHCAPGFEFPYQIRRFFFLGTMMELNFKKKRNGEPNIYDLLKCRQSDGSKLSLSIFSLVCTFVVFQLLNSRD